MELWWENDHPFKEGCFLFRKLCKLISLLLVFEGSTDLGIVSNILKLMNVSEGGSRFVDSTSTAVFGLLHWLTLEINSVQQKWQSLRDFPWDMKVEC